MVINLAQIGDQLGPYWWQAWMPHKLPNKEIWARLFSVDYHLKAKHVFKKINPSNIYKRKMALAHPGVSGM